MGSTKTFLKIVNKTKENMTITVTGTDNFDWDGSSRPDHNFNNVSINANSTREEREELNNNARSAWFTMHITFSNGDKISFRNDQHDAFSRIDRFYTLNGTNSDKYIACQMNPRNDVNSFVIFPFSLKNWMKSIPDSTSVLNISIPGTHESCAQKDGWSFGYGKCQNWELKTQLDNGVRYLDIRGEAIAKDTGDYITIKHGAVQQPYDLNQVLTDVIEFLQRNDTETVLLQLKQESSNWNGKDYANLIEKYITKDSYKEYFYLDQNNLKLSAVRGKIVLLNRFYNSSSYGINVQDWGDDTYFQKNNGVVKYNVQDVYKVCQATVEFSRDRKMDFVNLFFTDYAIKKDELNLCFCSAYCPVIATPYQFAYGDNGINERTSRQHLQSKTNWNGVLLFDFIDSYDSITIPYIIYNNF